VCWFGGLRGVGSSDEYAIETFRLTKYYGSLLAVNQVNLKVKRGKIHGLVGPNGAGKTTILKILCGILKPSSGDAKILRYSVLREPLKVKSLIGYIPERIYAYDALTVTEFLRFIGQLYQIPKGTLSARIEKYMEMFELEDYRDFFLDTLSKGLLQRVMVVSLFIREPKVYILDEPFYGLDPHSSWMFKKLLKEKVEEGASVLLSTHILEVVERFADTITIIDRGRIIAEGVLEELKKKTGEDRSLEAVFLKLTGGL